MNRIEPLRKEHGLSQQELAALLDVHQTAVSHWEKERTAPSFEVICKMSEHFNVSPMYLMGTSSERGCFSACERQNGGPQRNSNKARLLAAYDKLNSAGQQKALERVEELTEIPKYQNAEGD